MRVGLIQIDGKMPNLALLKLAAFHKARGDEVVYVDLSTIECDQWYGSKIFMGGSGYDITSGLPPEVEAITPDYALLNLNYSLGFTTRGCIRNCGFCIVREKEGIFHEVNMDWIRHTNVVVMDNNFLASKQWKEKLTHFADNKIKVNFNQGLDIRLINAEKAAALAKVKYYDRTFSTRRLYFAFDHPALESVIREKVAILKAAGIPGRHLTFYVLIGFDSTEEQDLTRIHALIDIGCKPYVMVFNKKKQTSGFAHTKKMQRWVNRRYYEFVDWDTFKKGPVKK